MKKMLLALLAVFLTVPAFAEEKSAGKLFIKEGARLAVVGDSITEQKMYSRNIEMYLTACNPGLKVKQFQFGWGGEMAAGFGGRMDNDLELFKPDVVTLCYGMNDAGYRVYTESMGKNYEKILGMIIKRLNATGALVIVGAPGAVDSKYYKGSVGAEVYNETLRRYAEHAKKAAEAYGLPFADIHKAMMEGMEKSKKELGEDYDVCGKDGVHPGENGHLIMAQTFLKAMGFDGDLGSITLDMKGSAEAAGGHKIISFTGGKAVIESNRYPFCFFGSKKTPGTTKSILPFISFNSDLNRFILKVKNLEAPAAKVVWGEVTKTFTREELEKGINLAGEYLDNPFSNVFRTAEFEVVKKEKYETEIIKKYITTIPILLNDLEDGESDAKIMAKRAELWANWEKMEKALPGNIIPVQHTIEILK